MTEQAKQDPRILSEERLDQIEADLQSRFEHFRSGGTLLGNWSDEIALLMMVRALQEQNAAAKAEITEHLRSEVWSLALKTTVEIEHAKGREKTHLLGKYEGIKALWELLGGDRPEAQDQAEIEEVRERR